MRDPSRPFPSARGFTLLEMSIVIMVLVALMSTGFFVTDKYNEWKVARQAGETLRTVYSAQRTYLADHPTAQVANITQADILPYLGARATAFPTVTSLEGAVLQIKVSATPPHAIDSGGARYDPSGSFTDLLWDVGQ